MKRIITILLSAAVIATAQQKISERPALTSPTLDSAADLFGVVDMSETGSARDKKTTLAEMWKDLGGANVSPTELGYLDGVTGAIQTAIDGKARNSIGTYYAYDFGARADGVTLYDGTYTSGSTAFTSATASFTSADIGKKIVLQLSQATRQILTISSVTNATTIVMNGTASASSSAYTQRITTYGSDNTAAIQSAINAAAAVGGVVKFDAGTYLVTEAPINPSTNNSIFLIPFAATIGDKAQALTLEGTGTPLISQFDFGQLPPLSGTVIYCTDTTTIAGDPAIFASVKDSYTGHTWDAVNTTLVVKNLTIRQPPAPTKHWFQCDKMGCLFMDTVNMDLDVPYWQTGNEPIDPQTRGFSSFGVVMPGQRSGYFSRLSKVRVSGANTGFCIGDISYIDHAFAELCKFGMTSKFTAVLNGAVTNFTHVGHFTSRCRVAFVGPLRVAVDQGIIETSRTGTAGVASWVHSEYDVDNFDGSIQGEMNICTVQGGVGPVPVTVRTNPLAAQDYYKLRITDLNATSIPGTPGVGGNNFANNRLGTQTHQNLTVKSMFTTPTHSLAVVGSGSGTTYGYRVGYCMVDGSIVLGSEVTISGPATLNSTNKIQITVPNYIYGAASYVFYRTTGGATQGKLPYTVSKIDAFNKVALDEGFTCDGITPATTAGLLTVGAGTWNGATITGPQVFSSTTRPTTAGTGTPGATSMITLADGDSRFQQKITYNLAADLTNNAGGNTDDSNSVVLPVGTWTVECRLFAKRNGTAVNGLAYLYHVSGGTITGYASATARYNDTYAQNPYYFSSNASLGGTVNDPNALVFGISGAGASAQSADALFDGRITVTGAPATFKFRITQSAADAGNVVYLKAVDTFATFTSRN